MDEIAGREAMFDDIRGNPHLTEQQKQWQLEALRPRLQEAKRAFRTMPDSELDEPTGLATI